MYLEKTEYILAFDILNNPQEVEALENLFDDEENEEKNELRSWEQNRITLLHAHVGFSEQIQISGDPILRIMNENLTQ